VALLSASCSKEPQGNCLTCRVLSDPDQFAWETFKRVVLPIDSLGRAHWERWALARKVFHGECKEIVWEDVSSEQGRERDDYDANLVKASNNADVLAKPDKNKPGTQLFSIASTGGQMVDPKDFFEVRMNKPAFDFLVEKNLHCLEGVKDAWQNRMLIKFPDSSIFVKAKWKEKPSTPERYHTAAITDLETWGLVGLHITTKDIPNWFWATFIHVDSAESKQLLSELKPAPPEFAGTVWQNYMLVGTQVSFVDSKGSPQRLINPSLEVNMYKNSSSCMTCHARATIGAPGEEENTVGHLAEFKDSSEFSEDDVRANMKGLTIGHTGIPVPTWYQDRFIQTDFIWSIAERINRAASTSTPPPLIQEATPQR